jgi:hypothetical protein
LRLPIRPGAPLASQSSLPGGVRARNRWSLGGFPYPFADAGVARPDGTGAEEPRGARTPPLQGGGGGRDRRRRRGKRRPRNALRVTQSPESSLFRGVGWGPRTPASDATTTRDPSRTPRVPAPRARTWPARRSRLIPPRSLPCPVSCATTAAVRVVAAAARARKRTGSTGAFCVHRRGMR